MVCGDGCWWCLVLGYQWYLVEYVIRSDCDFPRLVNDRSFVNLRCRVAVVFVDSPAKYFCDLAST